MNQLRCLGRGGKHKIALFGKRPSPYYGKNSSNKQREMTAHQYFKTLRSVNLFLQVQPQKPSSAMMKQALRRTATGKEDAELPLLQRMISLELAAPQFSPQKILHRVQVTDTSQHQLCRGDCVNQAFVVELLQ